MHDAYLGPLCCDECLQLQTEGSLTIHHAPQQVSSCIIILGGPAPGSIHPSHSKLRLWALIFPQQSEFRKPVAAEGFIWKTQVQYCVKGKKRAEGGATRM